MSFPPLFDMHCHLGFCSDATSIDAEVTARGEGMFSCGVDPFRFEEERDRCKGNVRVGLGLHPWWVERVGDAGLGSFLEQAIDAAYIGEIGLDAGKHRATFDQQVRVFTQICQTLAAHPGKLVSIHSVKSVDTVLDILEDTGALRGSTCILHWFSGTSQQLTRAIKAGCYISLGTFSLSYKRGKAYARQIPAERLLLETDYPPEKDTSFDYTKMHAPLESAASQLVEACNEDKLICACKTSAGLLSIH